MRVKKRATDKKFIARVLAVGNECDIALLTVIDEEFWENLSPLPFGVLPELQASVVVVGYPIGGENISVTAGVVSRVEIQDYTHGASQLLGIQIDAAINSGSSGNFVSSPSSLFFFFCTSSTSGVTVTRSNPCLFAVFVCCPQLVDDFAFVCRRSSVEPEE